MGSSMLARPWSPPESNGASFVGPTGLLLPSGMSPQPPACEGCAASGCAASPPRITTPRLRPGPRSRGFPASCAMTMTSGMRPEYLRTMLRMALATTCSALPRLSPGSSLPTALAAPSCIMSTSLRLSVHSALVVTLARARMRSPSRFTCSDATTMPSTAMRRRSSRAMSSAEPVPRPPSLYRSSSRALPMTERLPMGSPRIVAKVLPLRRGATPSIVPFSITVVCWTPHPLASCSWFLRKAYSPCTGTKCCGRVILMTRSSSSRQAWPEECRSRSMQISVPMWAIAFSIFCTRFSLPGICLAL
mmetsp:Transcript_268/g.867  ORF Transcript_268/g.867 Transcript_268/m.867 type:complete len:304 (+) Transcript_268:381-1292(+)